MGLEFTVSGSLRESTWSCLYGFCPEESQIVDSSFRKGLDEMQVITLSFSTNSCGSQSLKPVITIRRPRSQLTVTTVPAKESGSGRVVFDE